MSRTKSKAHQPPSSSSEHQHNPLHPPGQLSILPLSDLTPNTRQRYRHINITSGSHDAEPEPESQILSFTPDIPRNDGSLSPRSAPRRVVKQYGKAARILAGGRFNAIGASDTVTHWSSVKAKLSDQDRTNGAKHDVQITEEWPSSTQVTCSGLYHTSSDYDEAADTAFDSQRRKKWIDRLDRKARADRNREVEAGRVWAVVDEKLKDPEDVQYDEESDFARDSKRRKMSLSERGDKGGKEKQEVRVRSEGSRAELAGQEDKSIGVQTPAKEPSPPRLQARVATSTSQAPSTRSSLKRKHHLDSTSTPLNIVPAARPPSAAAPPPKDLGFAFLKAAIAIQAFEEAKASRDASNMTRSIEAWRGSPNFPGEAERLRKEAVEAEARSVAAREIKAKKEEEEREGQALYATQEQERTGEDWKYMMREITSVPIDESLLERMAKARQEQRQPPHAHAGRRSLDDSRDGQDTGKRMKRTDPKSVMAQGAAINSASDRALLKDNSPAISVSGKFTIDPREHRAPSKPATTKAVDIQRSARQDDERRSRSATGTHLGVSTTKLFGQQHEAHDAQAEETIPATTSFDQIAGAARSPGALQLRLVGNNGSPTPETVRPRLKGIATITIPSAPPRTLTTPETEEDEIEQQDELEAATAHRTPKSVHRHIDLPEHRSERSSPAVTQPDFKTSTTSPLFISTSCSKSKSECKLHEIKDDCSLRLALDKQFDQVPEMPFTRYDLSAVKGYDVEALSCSIRGLNEYMNPRIALDGKNLIRGYPYVVPRSSRKISRLRKNPDHARSMEGKEDSQPTDRDREGPFPVDAYDIDTRKKRDSGTFNRVENRNSSKADEHADVESTGPLVEKIKIGSGHVVRLIKRKDLPGESTTSIQSSKCRTNNVPGNGQDARESNPNDNNSKPPHNESDHQTSRVELEGKLEIFPPGMGYGWWDLRVSDWDNPRARIREMGLKAGASERRRRLMIREVTGREG